LKDMELIDILQETCTLASGRPVSATAKPIISINMEEGLKDTSKMMRGMALVSFNGQMVIDLRDNGKMEDVMDEASSLQRMDVYTIRNGGKIHIQITQKRFPANTPINTFDIKMRLGFGIVVICML